jgi:uncharacterized protein (DUF58 family)
MTALAPDGTTKAELALDVAGVFAALAVRHGDVVGAVFGDAAERCVIRPGGGRDHAEHVLRRLEDQANRANSAISSVPAVLERAAEARLPRGIVVLIADDADLPATAERSLSLLHARHQVMVAQIGDMAVGTDQAVNPYDVETGLEIPDEIWFDSDLRRAEARAGQTRAERIEHMFGSQGIARVSVNGRDDLVGALIRLFQRHRHGGT